MCVCACNLKTKGENEAIFFSGSKWQRAMIMMVWHFHQFDKDEEKKFIFSLNSTLTFMDYYYYHHWGKKPPSFIKLKWTEKKHTNVKVVSNVNRLCWNYFTTLFTVIIIPASIYQLFFGCCFSNNKNRTEFIILTKIWENYSSKKKHSLW